MKKPLPESVVGGDGEGMAPLRAPPMICCSVGPNWERSDMSPSSTVMPWGILPSPVCGEALAQKVAVEGNFKHVLMLLKKACALSGAAPLRCPGAHFLLLCAQRCGHHQVLRVIQVALLVGPALRPRSKRWMDLLRKACKQYVLT